MDEKRKGLTWGRENRDVLMKQRIEGLKVVLFVFAVIAFIMSLVLVMYLNILSFRLGDVGAFSLMVFVDAGLLYLATFLPE